MSEKQAKMERQNQPEPKVVMQLVITITDAKQGNLKIDGIPDDAEQGINLLLSVFKTMINVYLARAAGGQLAQREQNRIVVPQMVIPRKFN